MRPSGLLKSIIASAKHMTAILTARDVIALFTTDKFALLM